MIPSAKAPPPEEDLVHAEGGPGAPPRSMRAARRMAVVDPPVTTAPIAGSVMARRASFLFCAPDVWNSTYEPLDPEEPANGRRTVEKRSSDASKTKQERVNPPAL